MRFRFSSLVARAPLLAVFATLTQPGVPSVLFENIVLSHFQLSRPTGLAAEPKQHCPDRPFFTRPCRNITSLTDLHGVSELETMATKYKEDLCEQILLFFC